MLILVGAIVFTLTVAHGASAAGPRQGSGGVAEKPSGNVAVAGLPGSKIDLAGRWRGEHSNHGIRVPSDRCSGGSCNLVYDIVACKQGWCGTRVLADGKCGTATMTLSTQKADAPTLVLEGQLYLSADASPYAVRAWYNAGSEKEKSEQISMIGDTGGELMMFRRSFPFHARLVRAGVAACGLKNPVS